MKLSVHIVKSREVNFQKYTLAQQNLRAYNENETELV